MNSVLEKVKLTPFGILMGLIDFLYMRVSLIFLLFLVIYSILSVFCLYSLKTCMTPSLTHFFNQFVLCLTSTITVLLKILGDGCMGCPPVHAPQCFEGDRPRSSPKSPPMHLL